MAAEILEIQMLALLREFKGRLRKELYDDDAELIVHREWGVALENLCQQLFEDDIPVEKETLERIKDLTQQMQYPQKRGVFCKAHLRKSR